MKLFVRSAIIILIASLVIAVAPVTVLGQDDVCDSYNEAPELAELVAAGELPPVEERLPVNPVVVEPYEGIGQYGGTLYDLFDGSRLADFRTFGYENIVRWSVDGDGVRP